MTNSNSICCFCLFSKCSSVYGYRIYATSIRFCSAQCLLLLFETDTSLYQMRIRHCVPDGKAARRSTCDIVFYSLLYVYQPDSLRVLPKGFKRRKLSIYKSTRVDAQPSPRQGKVGRLVRRKGKLLNWPRAKLCSKSVDYHTLRGQWPVNVGQNGFSAMGNWSQCLYLRVSLMANRASIGATGINSPFFCHFTRIDVGRGFSKSEVTYAFVVVVYSTRRDDPTENSNKEFICMLKE